MSVGYIKENDFPDKKETDEWDKSSAHFYARSTEEKKIVGALRLVHDSEKGFPIEELYDASFLKKQEEKKIVEVSRRVTLPNRVKANFGLLRIICNYSTKEGITDFICSVNPKDIDFYLKLGFNQFGSLKNYSKVNNMPALGMHLELSKTKQPYKEILFSHHPSVFLD